MINDSRFCKCHKLSRLMLLCVQFYLLQDRLCYAKVSHTSQDAHYIPLDRVTVRPLPRGYAVRIGISSIDSRQKPGRAPGCIFSMQCGMRTHFMAADTPIQAQVNSKSMAHAFD